MTGASSEPRSATARARFCVPLPRGSEQTFCAMCTAVDATVTALASPRHEHVADTIAAFIQRGWTYALCTRCGVPVPRVTGSVQCADCTLADLLRCRPLSDEVELANVLASQGIVPDLGEAAVDAGRMALG